MINEKVRTIRLYGRLGTKFGRVHRAVVSNTSESIRYLCTMIPGFQQELATSADRGTGYACFIGKTNIDETQLDYPVGSEDIRIAPMVIGSGGGGLFGIVMGVVLIAAAAFTGGLALGLAGALLVGGSALMMNQPQDGLGTKDAPDNGASYNFNGVVNTLAQGNPWPLGYGRMICGGAACSISVYAEDQQ